MSGQGIIRKTAPRAQIKESASRGITCTSTLAAESAESPSAILAGDASVLTTLCAILNVQAAP